MMQTKLARWAALGSLLSVAAFLLTDSTTAQSIKFGDEGNKSSSEETSSRQGKAILFGDSNGNPPSVTDATEEIDARINVGAPISNQNNFQQQQQQFPAEYYNNYYQPPPQQQQALAGQRRPQLQQQQQQRPYYQQPAKQGIDRTELYYPNNGLLGGDSEQTEGETGGLFGLGLFDRVDVERTFVAPAVSGIVTAGVLLAAYALLGPILGLGFSVKSFDNKADTGSDPVAAREGRSFKSVFRDRYPDWYNAISDINPLEMSLKWMQIERDECRRRNICEFQERATKLPIFAKLFRAIFKRFAPRYIDAVEAAERKDSCDRLFTCTYGLRGLIDRIRGKLHTIFGKKNRI